MARARNIKPGLFLNEDLGTADPILSLLFIGLWCLADREGRLEDRPLRIKAALFPYREKVNVDKLLGELSRMNLIVRYEVGGEKCIEVVNFTKHQNPHPHEAQSRLPKKPEQNQCHDIDVTLHGLSVECNADSLIPDSLIPDTPPKVRPVVKSERLPLCQAWKDYCEMRVKIRKPMTEQAMKLAVVKLTALLTLGFDPVAVLQQSVFHNWMGLFEVKGQEPQPQLPPVRTPQADVLAERRRRILNDGR